MFFKFNIFCTIVVIWVCFSFFFHFFFFEKQLRNNILYIRYRLPIFVVSCRDTPHHNACVGGIIVASHNDSGLFKKAIHELSEAVGVSEGDIPFMPDNMQDHDEPIANAFDRLRDEEDWVSNVSITIFSPHTSPPPPLSSF